MRKQHMMSFARMLGAAAAALALSPAAFGQGCTTCNAPNTSWFHCPPKFVHWMEGPPKLKFKHACPKPVCDPCTLPHAGYYEPCWAPWPWPSDCSHCALPPAALAVTDAPANVAVPPPPPGAPAALPPKMEGAAPAKPMSQGARLPEPPGRAQKNIEASPVSR